MDAPLELALWTAGSILLSAVGGLLAWLAGQRPHSRLGQLGASLTGNPFGRATLFLVRFAFYIGLPYVALMNHALSPVVIGLLGTQTPDLPWWLLGWNTSEWVKALIGEATRQRRHRRSASARRYRCRRSVIGMAKCVPRHGGGFSGGRVVACTFDLCRCARKPVRGNPLGLLSRRATRVHRRSVLGDAGWRGARHPGMGA